MSDNSDDFIRFNPNEQITDGERLVMINRLGLQLVEARKKNNCALQLMIISAIEFMGGHLDEEGWIRSRPAQIL